ncbi:MAG: heme-binding protein [Chitinophagales bacterium]|nr:heme-binding protein [Chitinophagales bacterium]
MSQEAAKEILLKVELDSFTNAIAMDMGQRIVDLARSRNQAIAVEISRLNQSVFLYVEDGLPADKHNWLRRKANVAKYFEESSLAVRHTLEKRAMTLEKPFGLDEKDYIAKGGSIPVFVKNAGLIATITVSGLRDFEDHEIIIEGLKGKYL